ncbi:benzoate monooxygenase [Grosmannia clavigera kw1407]|uniref:Benzoate monooxygenase n=1 Tax=Grosmannia clavigera (strain kw1407 / UAMH 11150) TaxID=655863 RepID=F0X8Q3_GROCL|nr:benzoate monooxygenase [Grosmannia clavigera kw1407]EFX05480.1 benzoate monooxygenase [Grosmannia clavigera kw1407]
MSPPGLSSLNGDGMSAASASASAASSSGRRATSKDFVPSVVSDEVLETEFLIIGAGPAGSSLACFLASYGLKGIVISAAPGTANTPRAHITNMAAQECLRDIGLDQETTKAASKGACMEHSRWCHSMAGEEYARIYSWGNDPQRKGDYETASPCEPVDLPQTLLEPILVRRATSSGFCVRFDTVLASFEYDEAAQRYTATVHDRVTRLAYRIRTQYLFGADGAQSQVVRQLQLPLLRKPGQGLAVNVLVRADLAHLVGPRRGNLHWIMQPDRESPDFGWTCLTRMVKPWHEWLFILMPSPGADLAAEQPSHEQCRQRVQDFIGDDTPVEVLDVSRWHINEIVAESYSVGDVFCLGDAVHRHPPMNGLGSNTCIQDAFNLAWKISYVQRGWAAPALLASYSVERQPVGAAIIARANQGLRDHQPVWEALGMFPPDIEARRAVLDELRAPTAAGRERRKVFQAAIEQTAHEFHGLGIEMGQRYENSTAVYTADEPAPYALPPGSKVAEDPVLYYAPSTYPGVRLPHVWLNRATPEKATSTIDLAGHGRFVLFTGIGGRDAWRTAAAAVTAQLGPPLDVHAIGFRQEWEDVYFDWERLRGVEESGAVLVRPDRFVAWRCPEVLDSPDACALKLLQVMRAVLGFGNADS